jgi:hypothetical protein
MEDDLAKLNDELRTISAATAGVDDVLDQWPCFKNHFFLEAPTIYKAHVRASQAYPTKYSLRW